MCVLVTRLLTIPLHRVRAPQGFRWALYRQIDVDIDICICRYVERVYIWVHVCVLLPRLLAIPLHRLPASRRLRWAIYR